MAWGIRGVGSVTTVASGNVTLTEPTGAAEGDLLVACIGYRGNAAFTLPSGWTLVATQQSSGDTDATSGIASGVMAYIVRGASAPALTFTRTAGDVAQGQIIAYTGVNSGDPYDTGSAATLGASGSTASTTGITTAEADELLVAMVSAGDAHTTSAFDAATDPATASGTTDTTTAPTAGTWIERADTTTGTGADHGLAVADGVKATAGATGAFTATTSANSRSVMIVGAFKMPVTRTTAQAGDSDETTTWTGGVIPSAGENVIINHAVTVPAGTAFPASGDIADLTVNEDLTVNGTLNFAGNAVFASSKLLGAGTFQGNPAAGQSKVIQFGTAHSQTGVGAFMVGASLGSPAVIRKNASSTGTLSVDDGAFFGGGQADMQFVHLIGLGSASVLGWQHWLRSSGHVFRLIDFIADGCGRFAETSGAHAGSIYLLQRGEFKNSPQSDENVEIRNQSGALTGTRQWDDVTFDKGVRHYASELTVQNCRIFGQYATLAALDAVTETSWHDNYLYKTGVEGTGFSIPRGSLKRAYVVVDGNVANPHWLTGQSSADFITHFNECIMEGPGSTGTAGDGILGNSPSVAATSIVKNCIMLPNAGGNSPGKIVSMLGGTNYSVSIEHCTYISTDSSGEHGVGFGETYAGRAGMITSLKSNLVWTPPWRGGGSVLKRIANSTQDVVAAANCSHNGKWNLGTGTDGTGYNGVGAVTVDIWSGTAGGANDVEGDPEFVDYWRNLAKWDLTLSADLGSARTISSLTRSAEQVTATLTGHGYVVGSAVRIAGATPSEYNGDWIISSVPDADTFTFRILTTPTTPASTAGSVTREGSVAHANAQLKARVTGYTVSDLIDYVRAGFAPTNSAFDTTAHDGTTIGAVPFQSTGFEGDGAASWPAWTAAGTGSLSLEADGAASLPQWTASATGTVTGTAADGAATLPEWTAAGTSEFTVTADGAATLPQWTGAGTAATPAEGTGSATLPQWTASGTVSTEVNATGAATTPAWTASAAGTITGTEADGTAALPEWTAAGTVSTEIVANGAASLPQWTAAGTGTARLSAEGAATLPEWTAAGTAEGEVSAEGAATLPEWTAEGTGNYGAGFQADGAASWEEWTGVGTGTVTGTEAEGSATLPEWTAAGTGAPLTSADGAVSWEAWTAAGTSESLAEAEGEASWAEWTAAGAASFTALAEGAATLPEWTGSGTGVYGLEEDPALSFGGQIYPL